MQNINQILDTKFKNLLFEGIFKEPEAFRIEEALICLALDQGLQEQIPQLSFHLTEIYAARQKCNIEDQELAVINLYLALHSAGAGYNPEEQQNFEASKGIQCLPGGILPLVLSCQLMDSHSVVADLGCGNGLQGLLLQTLIPHRKTIQVELSGSMLSMGKLYQKALDLDERIVEWRHGDICTADLSGVDLIYMYRPVRPTGPGAVFYRSLAEKLSSLQQPVTVISVADCLKDFLGKDFFTLYHNDYLTIFSSADL